jgi:hypothetical protein
MTEKGISEEYTGYNFRHAMNACLINGKLSEVQVNAFIGHTYDPYTAPTKYFRLDRKLVGSKLASGNLKPNPAEAVRIISADNTANQKKECALCKQT